jgi:hypothetical protein
MPPSPRNARPRQRGSAGRAKAPPARDRRPAPRDAVTPRAYSITTFAYEEGAAEPYVLMIESPGGECRTYRWATARERDKAARELATRPPPVEARSAPTADGEPPIPPPDGIPSAGDAPPPAAPTTRGPTVASAVRRVRSRTLSVAAACATCGAAPLAVAAGAPAFVRFPLVVLFVCLVPGTAVLDLIGPLRVPFEPGLVVATSLGISAVTAQSMLWLGVWAPDPFLNALAAGSIAVIAVANLRERAALG